MVINSQLMENILQIIKLLTSLMITIVVPTTETMEPIQVILTMVITTVLITIQMIP